jgi:hypothetical protein
MMMTLMPAALAFFTTGMRAVVSEGASTMALAPRSMALSTMLISSFTFDSDWGPRKVTENFGAVFRSSLLGIEAAGLDVLPEAGVAGLDDDSHFLPEPEHRIASARARMTVTCLVHANLL